MKFLAFLEEKIFFILHQVTFIFLFIVFFQIFKIPFFYLLFFISISIFYIFSYLFFSYIQENKKYKRLRKMVDDLEEKYLIAEVIDTPKRLENKAYFYALKKASKAMNDKISQLEKEKMEYREYIESFAHEIKTPLAILSLLVEKQKNIEWQEEVDKINNYVEQILFYARSNDTEKDYFVKKILVEDIIHIVLLQYKVYLLKRKIIIKTSGLDKMVYTDEKWIVFILAQIIQNAIKYVDKKEKEIIICCKENKNNTILSITDNGCGIKEEEKKRIFEKGFTGTNRNKKSATGMGLYLSKKLCDKLGLKIQMASEENKYTRIEILFPKGKMHNLNEI